MKISKNILEDAATSRKLKFDGTSDFIPGTLNFGCQKEVVKGTRSASAARPRRRPAPRGPPPSASCDSALRRRMEYDLDTSYFDK